LSSAVASAIVRFIKLVLAGKSQTFVDLLGNHSDQVTINSDGYGDFPVAERSLSVWGLAD